MQVGRTPSVLGMVAGLCLNASAPVAQQVDPHETDMFNMSIYEQVEAQMFRVIGPSEMVWHELISPDIHVDILPFPPTKDRPFWVLSTMGMSFGAMTVPDGVEEREFWLRAELMMALPPDWFGSEAEFDNLDDPAIYYPIERLKELARYPHNAGTALAASHTFKFGEALGPGTKMDSVLIWWPTFLREGEDVVELEPRGNVNLYAIIPIYESERQYAVDNGTDALLGQLADAGIDSIYDPARTPVVN